MNYQDGEKGKHRLSLQHWAFPSTELGLTLEPQLLQPLILHKKLKRTSVENRIQTHGVFFTYSKIFLRNREKRELNRLKKYRSAEDKLLSSTLLLTQIAHMMSRASH